MFTETRGGGEEKRREEVLLMLCYDAHICGTLGCSIQSRESFVKTGKQGFKLKNKCLYRLSLHKINQEVRVMSKYLAVYPWALTLATRGPVMLSLSCHGFIPFYCY